MTDTLVGTTKSLLQNEISDAGFLMSTFHLAPFSQQALMYRFKIQIWETFLIKKVRLWEACVWFKENQTDKSVIGIVVPELESEDLTEPGSVSVIVEHQFFTFLQGFIGFFNSNYLGRFQKSQLLYVKFVISCCSINLYSWIIDCSPKFCSSGILKM